MPRVAETAVVEAVPVEDTNGLPLSPCDSPDLAFRTLDAMRLIAVEWADAGYTVPISLDRLVARAWMPRRIEQCRRRLAEGGGAPPITVVRYRCGDRWLYEPSDGNHRTVAAREAGRRRIRATVAGERVCRPENFATCKGWLVTLRDGGVGWTGIDLSEELEAALARLGVGRL